MKYFNELGLLPAFERVIKERGFTEATDIQEQSIPILLDRATDFIGLAQTGTGKTAAFGLPLLQHINTAEKTTQGIILCPTREIAIQTFKELNLFCKYLKSIKLENVYGGTPVMQQAKRIKKNAPHIIVGTPGRVIDLLKRKSINLATTRYFILDEADEMLNMGFEQDIKQILEFADHHTNIWLFSATMPGSIRQIVKKYMHEPVEVAVNKGEKVNKNIKHKYSFVNRANKFDKLLYIIEKAPELYGVIFCRMKSETEQLAQDLSRAGISAEAINGDLSQSKREQVIRRFKAKKTRIMVASDVAARGLDVKNLTHVIHYALPDTFEYYTHRSGRTGRAGEDGLSIAFIGKSEMGKLKRMEKSLNIKFEEYKIDLRPPSIEEKIQTWVSSNEEVELLTDSKTFILLSEQIESWSRDKLIAAIIKNSFATSEKELKYSEMGFRGEKIRGSAPREFKKENYKNSKPEASKVRRKDKKSKTKERPNKKPREEKSGNDKFTDIFINIGYSDGFGDIALADFIQKNTGIDKNKLGHFEVNKRFSLFELDNGSAKQLDFLFNDVQLKGRRIIAKIDREAN